MFSLLSRALSRFATACLLSLTRCCFTNHSINQSITPPIRPGPDAKVEDVEFEPNEVYAIDIVVSSGECW